MPFVHVNNKQEIVGISNDAHDFLLSVEISDELFSNVIAGKKSLFDVFILNHPYKNCYVVSDRSSPWTDITTHAKCMIDKIKIDLAFLDHSYRNDIIIRIVSLDDKTPFYVWRLNSKERFDNDLCIWRVINHTLTTIKYKVQVFKE